MKALLTHLKLSNKGSAVLEDHSHPIVDVRLHLVVFTHNHLGFIGFSISGMIIVFYSDTTTATVTRKAGTFKLSTGSFLASASSHTKQQEP